MKVVMVVVCLLLWLPKASKAVEKPLFAATTVQTQTTVAPTAAEPVSLDAALLNTPLKGYHEVKEEWLGPKLVPGVWVKVSSTKGETDPDALMANQQALLQEYHPTDGSALTTRRGWKGPSRFTAGSRLSYDDRTHEVVTPDYDPVLPVKYGNTVRLVQLRWNEPLIVKKKFSGRDVYIRLSQDGQTEDISTRTSHELSKVYRCHNWAGKWVVLQNDTSIPTSTLVKYMVAPAPPAPPTPVPPAPPAPPAQIIYQQVAMAPSVVVEGGGTMYSAPATPYTTTLVGGSVSFAPSYGGGNITLTATGGSATGGSGFGFGGSGGSSYITSLCNQLAGCTNTPPGNPLIPPATPGNPYPIPVNPGNVGVQTDTNGVIGVPHPPTPGGGGPTQAPGTGQVQAPNH